MNFYEINIRIFQFIVSVLFRHSGKREALIRNPWFSMQQLHSNNYRDIPCEDLSGIIKNN
jgi:hypothetical protein